MECEDMKPSFWQSAEEIAYELEQAETKKIEKQEKEALRDKDREKTIILARQKKRAEQAMSELPKDTRLTDVHRCRTPPAVGGRILAERKKKESSGNEGASRMGGGHQAQSRQRKRYRRETRKERPEEQR